MLHELLKPTSLSKQWTLNRTLFNSQAVETAELLSVLLGLSLADSLALLQRLTGSGQPYPKLRDLTAGELQNQHQIGKVRAARLLAALELGKRIYTTPCPTLLQLNEPVAVASLLEYHIAHSEVERFAVISLDVKLRLLALDVLSIGSQTECCVTPRDVFRTVMQHRGTVTIVGHNHPSGLNGTGDSLEPSPEDLALTRSLLVAGKALGIQVLDHLIVAGKGWNSLRESTSLWRETKQDS